MSENPWGRIVSKALQDEGFKQRLIADPTAVLAVEGIALPGGISVRVVEDTESVRHLVLPVLPESLTEEQLGAIAGGTISNSCPPPIPCCACPPPPFF